VLADEKRHHMAEASEKKQIEERAAKKK